MRQDASRGSVGLWLLVAVGLAGVLSGCVTYDEYVRERERTAKANPSPEPISTDDANNPNPSEGSAGYHPRSGAHDPKSHISLNCGPAQSDAFFRDPTNPPKVISTFSGDVSFYHDALEGRKTASGEPYNPCAFTAASRTLALGTWVRVTRIETGGSVVVRVNDRGPFGKRARVLDLSRAAAEKLRMIEQGVIKARVQVFSWDKK